MKNKTFLSECFYLNCNVNEADSVRLIWVSFDYTFEGTQRALLRKLCT